MERRQSTARRVNPRRPYVISARGLKRIILGAEEGSRDLLLSHHAAARKQLRTTQPFERHMLVLVHTDRGMLDEHARQAIAAAALLADGVTGVVVAVLGGTTADLGACGADAVINLPQLDAMRFCPEQTLALAQQLIARYQPVHIFLPDRSADGDLGRRLAARTGRTIATDVVELDASGACRLVPGGRFARCALPQVMLLARHAADADLPFIGHGTIEEVDIPAALQPGVRDLGLETSSPDQIGLEEADFILSGGNGMRDMDTFGALAKALGAATGASRVAVDDGRFPRAKQIGATGKTVQASAYLALGISGAVQHLQGIKDCRHVIAVNLDDSAPIVKRANLTLVEDAQALMGALLRQVEAARAAAAA
ncbi:electron transfer flavoprotein subunit alpha/FixB family protein [Massilia putida]|uniref:electron transfer flavoprotein subunit alpha/FixB family protein n=1 Tax=Massilia putida TaxID=1141883 RepID=UPI0009514C45|nr:electron transfer flavoprotein subunit alpha/FixB family protein [Massilia putida]